MRRKDGQHDEEEEEIEEEKMCSAIGEGWLREPARLARRILIESTIAYYE